MLNANWDKIRKEISKIKDLDSLKKELNKLTREIKRFDIQNHLSEQATRRLKNLEDQYQKVVDAIMSIQKQIDIELNKTIGHIKNSQKDVKKKMGAFKKSADGQKKKLRKMSTQLKKSVAKKAKASKKKKASKKATKKTTAKKATKKKTTKKR